MHGLADDTGVTCGKQEHELRISCSIGIPESGADADQDVDSALQAVDRAMYAAKGEGGSVFRVDAGAPSGVASR